MYNINIYSIVQYTKKVAVLSYINVTQDFTGEDKTCLIDLNKMTTQNVCIKICLLSNLNTCRVKSRNRK